MNHNIRFLTFYLSIFICSVAYGFIYVLPLLTHALHGNSVDVAYLLSLAGITTILSVGYTGKLSFRISPSRVCGIGTLSLMMGFLQLSTLKSLSFRYYLSGILLGFGWSLCYAAAPMRLNRMVNDDNRTKHIGLLAAFVVLGTGISPLVVSIMASYNFTLLQIYHIPSLLLIVPLIVFMCDKSYRTPPKKTAGLSSLVKFFENPSALNPIIMAFLGACIFSTMMNYQTIYAKENHLNYSVYYICYMLSVIACRFTLSGVIDKYRYIVTYLLLLMLVGLGLLFFHSSVLLYGLAAISIGTSYGLIYPLIKSSAISSVSAEIRDDIVAYFSLAYFFGVYFFPLLAGPIIYHFGFKAILLVLIFITCIDVLISLQLNPNRRRKKNHENGFRT